MIGGINLRHVWCPACGLFGIRARLAARRHADHAHILWAAGLLGRRL